MLHLMAVDKAFHNSITVCSILFTKLHCSNIVKYEDTSMNTLQFYSSVAMGSEQSKKYASRTKHRNIVENYQRNTEYSTMF